MENHMYTYVDNVNANLICCICTMPFLAPTCSTKCNHTFCQTCIGKALETTLQCPIDRSPLTLDDLQPAPQIIRNLVDELPVYCIHKESGCAQTTQRQLLAYHTKHECMFARIKCCEEECEEFILKKDTEKHSKDCPHRLLKCEACGTLVRATEMEAHAEDSCSAKEITCPYCSTTLERSLQYAHEAECPQIVVACTQASNGCPWTGERYSLEWHTPTCPYEAIKGFFTINTARISNLEAENSKLRQEITDMKRSLGAAERDLEVAKASLGPWFRVAGGTNTVSAVEQPRREPRERERVQRRRLSSPLNTSIFGFPAEGSAGSVGRDNDLEDPFSPPPASVNVNISPGSPQQYMDPAMLASLNEMSAARLPFASESYVFARGQGPSPVAPVDLNTSLEGSLASLRNSIVQLSASFDALDSRQDIMLGTETLRRREEVGSLRAIVHGLRMQVHAILMDRNNQALGRMNPAIPPPGTTMMSTASGPLTHRPAASLDDFSPDTVYLNQNLSRIGPLPFLGHRRPSMENKL